MITEIDVRTVLTQIGHGRPDLVTRPTGRAVRSSIEPLLAQLPRPAVIVLNFTAVRVIDCSCADEIVAKLVEQYLAGEQLDAVFLLRGLHDHQITDIEEVLRNRRLALVAEVDGGALRVIGEIGAQARAAFAVLLRDAGFELPLAPA